MSTKLKVYSPVAWAEVTKSGIVPIGCRWVDLDKGDVCFDEWYFFDYIIIIVLVLYMSYDQDP